MSAVVLAAKVREEWWAGIIGKRKFKGNGEGQPDDENGCDGICDVNKLSSAGALQLSRLC